MNPTGSGLERAASCAASLALNQARNTGADAIRGVENHDGIENDAAAGRNSKHAVVRQALEDATAVSVEAAYAIDVVTETVRYLGSRIQRGYGELGENEIALTLDAKVVRPDGVWVWDWKSRKRVTAAAKNFQLRAACVAVMKVDGLSQAHGGIGYLDNDEADTHTFDTFDMAKFFADMRGMLERIRKARALVASGGVPEVHSGPWCDYCPAMAYCPAQNRLALTMLGELDYVAKELAFLTPEQAGKAWVLLKQIQKLADKVEESLKLRAKSDVVPLPNGKRLALVDTSRTSFDSKKAIAWIREHGGDPDQFQGRTYFSKVAEINMPALPAEGE